MHAARDFFKAQLVLQLGHHQRFSTVTAGQYAAIQLTEIAGRGGAAEGRASSKAVKILCLILTWLRSAEDVNQVLLRKTQLIKDIVLLTGQ